MITFTKNNLSEKLSEVTTEITKLLEKENVIFVDFLSEEQYKSRKQNNTFHALIDCFWKSRVSSFKEKKDMRFYYKSTIGLIETTYCNNKLTEETKNMVWKAIQLLPLATGQKAELQDILKGRVYKEHSWSEAKKQRASEAIDNILCDMNEAGVITSKEGKNYEKILEGMNADKWWA